MFPHFPLELFNVIEVIVDNVAEDGIVDRFIAVNDEVAKLDHYPIVLVRLDNTQILALLYCLRAGGSDLIITERKYPLAYVDHGLHENLQIAFDGPFDLPVIL
jgi:hypothetical protein